MDRSTYVSEFNKKNYKMYPFRIRKDDKDIIEKLDHIPNRNAYIKSLIYSDINPQILTIKQIKTLIRPIIEKYHIEDVYLFGSYSRGEARSDSDVDIYCSPGDIRSLYDESRFKSELEEALNKKVDVVTIGSYIDDYFKKQIEEDMIKIY